MMVNGFHHGLQGPRHQCFPPQGFTAYEHCTPVSTSKARQHLFLASYKSEFDQGAQRNTKEDQGSLMNPKEASGIPRS
eukprot:12431448-Karenia_brevis.AAC.2